MLGKHWSFKRGLDSDFVSALEELATKQSWFADVLADSELTIGIRNNYFNVYFDGQSLFKVRWDTRGRSLMISTHPKYLMDPDLSKQVRFNGQEFDVSSIEPMAKVYEPGETLKRLKRATKLYANDEKKGVQKIVKSNRCVIDLEVALSKAAEREDSEGEENRGRIAKRVDIACFEKINAVIHLCFWEAKDYKNADLWTSGDAKPPVVDQISGYRELIERYRTDILESYQTVANNLVSIAKMAGRDPDLCPLIRDVSNGTCFRIDTQPRVGVVVFGFSKADKQSERHRLMLEKLKKDSGLPVAVLGRAKGIVLKSAKD